MIGRLHSDDRTDRWQINPAYFTPGESVLTEGSETSPQDDDIYQIDDVVDNAISVEALNRQLVHIASFLSSPFPSFSKNAVGNWCRVTNTYALATIPLDLRSQLSLSS